MKKLILLTAITTSLFAGASVVHADYGTNCQTQYGTSNCPSTTTVVVDKTVQNPSTKKFVDNLGPNDAKYAPNQTVPFKIVVTNSSTSTLSNIVVTDIIPQYTKLPATKGGLSGGNTVTMNVDKLNPGESKTFDLSLTVVDNASLPADQGVICTTNKVDMNSSAASAHDEASFCIAHATATTTKGGLSVFPAPVTTSTPKTGPELFALIGLIPSAAAGLVLRKKAAK